MAVSTLKKDSQYGEVLAEEVDESSPYQKKLLKMYTNTTAAKGDVRQSPTSQSAELESQRTSCELLLRSGPFAHNLSYMDKIQVALKNKKE